MYYTIYKTTNLVNNKIYIGVHETEDLNDDYLGSGRRIGKALKKYGYDNFKKETLMLFESRKEMLEAERLIVNQHFVDRKDTYNMAIGGCMPPDVTGQKRSKRAKENYKNAAAKRDKDYAKRIAIIRKETGSYEIQRSVAKQMGLANKGIKRSPKEVIRITEHTKNSRWFTNGLIDKFIHKDLPIPEGFKLGRSKAKSRNRIKNKI